MENVSKNGWKQFPNKYQKYPKYRNPEVSVDLGCGYKMACWINEGDKRVYQMSYNPGFGEKIVKMYFDEVTFAKLGTSAREVIRKANKLAEVL